MARPDRDSMNEDLAARTEGSYATRDQGIKYPDVFQKELGIQTWYADKGEHEVDVLPYQAGPNDPLVKEGAWQYMLDMFVHRNVGPRELQFLCLDAMYNEACPICKYRGELRKNPPEGKRQLEQHEERLKELKPSRRSLYNVIVYDSKDEVAKGVQVWQVAHYFFERHVAARAKLPKSKGGGYQMFSHPDKDQGRSITFVRSGSDKATKYEAHNFHKRDYDIADEDLEDCKVLDQIAHIPTYAEVNDAFWDEAGPEDAAVEPEEEPPAPRRGGRVAQGELEEEEAPRPRRSRKPASEEEEPPAPRRGRGRTSEPEEEEPSHPRKLSRVGGEDEGDIKCPVAGGTFGVDADEYDDCEDCKHWDACVAEKAKK